MNWTIDLSFWSLVLFAVAGVGTGIVNTLAGSGSLVTLPVFMFLCGLPAPIANGTNRIGALLQSGVGFYGFRRSGMTSFQGATWLVVPAVAGAIVGSRIAVSMTELAMQITIGGLMVFMLIVLLVQPERWIRPSQHDAARGRHLTSVVTFFLIGVYGGFIQAGVGIFLLAGLVLVSRYTLSAGNGVKLLIVFSFTLPALFVFLQAGQVHMGYGLLMAVFQSIGAWIGVRFVARVPRADVWIHRLLIVIVAVASVKMIWELVA